MPSPGPDELLSWYDAHRRRLPWRGETDPYRVWVSEVMLQQTQAETVASRYPAFLARFPTVETLAAAGQDEVLAAWSGLGYYRRARLLHAAARQLAARRQWPRSAVEWRSMPGVGDYTAAAVASIAYGEAVAVVDGNVARLMSRLHGLREAASGAAGRRLLTELAAAWLDPARPGDSNQALMELGATICSPRRPKCAACPLAAHCLAWRSGEPEKFPEAARRRMSEKRQGLVAVVCRGQETLLFRRSVDQEVLTGMWELPWVERNGDSAPGALGRKYGGSWRLLDPCGTVHHSITYRRLEVEVYAAVWLEPRDSAPAQELIWVRPEALSERPVSSLVTKAVALVHQSYRLPACVTPSGP